MYEIGIVFSKIDNASMNVFSIFSKRFKLKKIDTSNTISETYVVPDLQTMVFLIEEDIVDAHSLENKNLDVNRLIFVSRHKSESKIPTFLVHFPGMWTKSKRNRLALADACLAKKLLSKLVHIQKDPSLSSWHISLEATHHEPVNITVPIAFIEIGSSPSEWNNKLAGEVIFNTIVEVIKEGIPHCDSIVGFGGTHYAPTFTRIAIQTNYGVGHILPKYHVDEVTEDAVLEALEKTSPYPKFAIIDWKGLKSHQRSKIIRILREYGIEFKKAREILKNNF